MEKMNFEQLKKDQIIEVKNDYSAKLNHGQQINTPMLKILFDYFNVLNDRKKMQKEQNMTIQGIINARNAFVDNLPERANGNINYKVVIKYKDEFNIFLVLSRYMTDGNWVSEVSFTSNKSSYISSEFIYKKIIYSAIAHSNLKGSYFTMPHNELAWDKRALEVRGYEDVYLPETIMEDLKLFTGLFEKSGEIMRYLFAGTPGTGKTESTLAIANVLKKNGVTIMKTVVCDALKEKIELAELLSPCLIIFDDIDLSLGSRNKGGVSRSLGTFLDALDGTDKISNGVGIIATTNSIDLLDLAAQRPGRFDKIMSFDQITKGNIKNIILKSLKYNFKISKNHRASKTFINKKVVELFHSSRVTGSHVYSSIRQIMRKIDTLGLSGYDVDWICSEINQELKTMESIRNAHYLNNTKLKEDNSKPSSGFALNQNDEEDYCEKIEDEEIENEECDKCEAIDGSAGFSIKLNDENLINEPSLTEDFGRDEMPDGV